MAAVSTIRLNVLRCGYALLAIGLGLTVWPRLLARGPALELLDGVVQCMLGAMELLALLGLRYPLKMLPLLFFEMIWKLLWLGIVALPLLRAHRLSGDAASTLSAVLIVVVFPFVVPWDYVRREYLRAPAERWRGSSVAAVEQRA